ncbi:MAG: hypothetical protein WD038_02960 [Balneolales bacterium]
MATKKPAGATMLLVPTWLRSQPRALFFREAQTLHGAYICIILEVITDK